VRIVVDGEAPRSKDRWLLAAERHAYPDVVGALAGVDHGDDSW
jgi:hypothetical protein